MSSVWSIVVVFGLLSAIFSSQVTAQQKDKNVLLEKIAANPELSEIYGMIERSGYNHYTADFAVTLFAPTNEAFQKYKNGIKDELLVSYHILPGARTIEQLSLSETTSGSGSPRVFVTKTRENEYYVNNAKILKNQSTIIETPGQRKKKVLHIVNEVLQPLRSKSEDVEDNPTVFGLLESSSRYNLGPYQISNFASRIRPANRTENFRSQGLNTYFIPIDEAHGKRSKSDLIDQKVIDAHVIFGKVLFLNPTPENEVFETASFSDSVKVVASITSNSYNGNKIRYARSNTVVGNYNHPAGAVMSEIVLPNIPVQNGVVHLIKQPLMVIDKTVQQFLDESNDALVGIFKDKLKYASEVFRRKLAGQQGITLFIPSNDAWRDLNVERALENNTNLLKNILDLHLVSELLPINTIRERESKGAATLWNKQFLFFNLIMQNANHTLTVEGVGVNATVLHSDLGAINGVIHIIDRVLGIPYATVGRKLATDPMLNKTYNLGNIPYVYGKYRNFNDRLDDVTKNYTYFVPKDAAWKLFDLQHPDLSAALSDPRYANQFLEKHLIEDRNYTMADLKRLLQNETYLLQTKNGGLNIKVREVDKGFEIFWNKEWIAVVRPDLRCTNGIVHVIDKVLIKPGDVTVPVGGALNNYISLPVLLLFVLPLGMMVLYH